MQKVITIHVQQHDGRTKRGKGNASNSLRLTATLVGVLSAIQTEYRNPTLRTTADGIGVFVPDYSPTV